MKDAQGWTAPTPGTPPVYSIVIAPLEDGRGCTNPCGSIQIWAKPHFQFLSNITVKKHAKFALLTCLAPALCGHTSTCAWAAHRPSAVSGHTSTKYANLSLGDLQRLFLQVLKTIWHSLRPLYVLVVTGAGV